MNLPTHKQEMNLLKGGGLKEFWVNEKTRVDRKYGRYLGT